MKENDIKDKKPLSLSRFIFILLIVIYVVLILGNNGVEANVSAWVYRYIPAGITGFLSMFLGIKAFTKGKKKLELEDINKQLMFIPIIVATIIFAYGMYSLYSNISEYKKDKEDFYNTFFSSVADEMNEFLNKQIEEAKKVAIKTWAVTSLSYLTLGECAVFLRKNKLNDFLEEDEVVLQDSNAEGGGDNYRDNDDESNQPVNNIKWDL